MLHARALLRRQSQGPLRRAFRKDRHRAESNAPRELVPRPPVRLLHGAGRLARGNRAELLGKCQGRCQLLDRQIQGPCRLERRQDGHCAGAMHRQGPRCDTGESPSSALRDHRRIRQLHERAGRLGTRHGVQRRLRTRREGRHHEGVFLQGLLQVVQGGSYGRNRGPHILYGRPPDHARRPLQRIQRGDGGEPQRGYAWARGIHAGPGREVCRRNLCGVRVRPFEHRGRAGRPQGVLRRIPFPSGRRAAV